MTFHAFAKCFFSLIHLSVTFCVVTVGIFMTYKNIAEAMISLHSSVGCTHLSKMAACMVWMYMLMLGIVCQISTSKYPLVGLTFVIAVTL